MRWKIRRRGQGGRVCGSKFVTLFRGFSFDALHGEQKISFLNKLPAVTQLREFSYVPKAKYERFAVHLNYWGVGRI